MTHPAQDDLRLRLAGSLQRLGGVARRSGGFGVWGARAIGLLFGLALAGCERASEEPQPDMALIRGEPIVSMARVEGRENPAASTEPATDWITDEDGLILVEFDQLAGFEYVVDEDAAPSKATKSADQIPRAIRELDGREVGVRGFMLPIRMEGGLVREFLLMRDQSMCCFGVIPKINEWVAVTMSGRGVRAMMDQPVTVFGTLRVGEVYEHGVLGGIYRMEGEELAGALDL